jgi:hypothetical protein
MKAKIRLTNGVASSPILLLDCKNQQEFEKAISEFKGKFSKSTDPKQAMVDFIIFAYNYSKTLKPKEIYENINHGVLETNEVHHISLRTPNIVEFVYKKEDGKTDWRTLDLVEEDAAHVKGFDIDDNNKYKSFKKNCIVGGRMLKKQIK